MEERFPESLDMYLPVQEKFGLNWQEYHVIEIVDKTIGEVDDPFRIFRSVAIPLVAESVKLSASRVYHIVDDLIKKGVLKRVDDHNYTRLRPTDQWLQAVKPWRVKHEKKRK
ncbi:hypothetical protein ES702_07481 [subsurface metagenome]